MIAWHLYVFARPRRYEATLLAHCGLRRVEPAGFEGYDPDKKTMMAQVAIDRDMQPIEVRECEDDYDE
jgi:3-oxoacyl-ACP reductase-like protein